MSDAFPQDWIPLSQQVPDFDVDVLVGVKGKKPEIAHLESITTSKDHVSLSFLQGYDVLWYDPTHWMPLPDTNCLPLD